uniref:Methyltransf_21 domain-containing protein n=1 Tax=Trichuris muris TaxID=70415 RepID=A0A5S6QVP7_TRIMR
MKGTLSRRFCFINGVRIGTSSRSTVVLMLVVACFLIIPFLSLFNNAMYKESYDGLRKLTDDYIAEWSSDDPRLLEHVRKNYLIAPPNRSELYNLVDSGRLFFSQKKQDKVVAELFNGKRNGFFVEAGAYDGETYSNTLYFERQLNWTGLLVEPDFGNQKKLLAKRRKAWILQGCLEGGDRPKKMRLYGAMELGALEEYMSFSRWFFTKLWRPVELTEVWCFPLETVLLAIGQTHVDYFVLDVEGAEMSVLRSLPLDRLDITVMQMEYSICSGAYWDRDQTQNRLKEMRNFMTANLPQYEEYRPIALDLIYVKRVGITQVKCNDYGALISTLPLLQSIDKVTLHGYPLHPVICLHRGATRAAYCKTGRFDSDRANYACMQRTLLKLRTRIGLLSLACLVSVGRHAAKMLDQLVCIAKSKSVASKGTAV